MKRTRIMAVIIVAFLSALPSLSIALAAQPGPVFSFPSSGTIYPYTGSYLFQVQPVAGAKGYLWSFIQDGAIRYQNLSDDGSLSGPFYTIKPGSPAQHRLHAGPLTVSVRAALGLDQWTAASSITVQLRGKGAPPSGPHSKSSSGPPSPGTVLYHADTASGLTAWAGSSEWKHVNGLLVNDGSSSTSTIIAPYRPQESNYAIEAQIQLVQGQAFGIVARATGGQGYLAGFYSDGGTRAAILAGAIADIGLDSELAGQAYSRDTSYHTYRVEVQGNTVRLSVDGAPLLSATDNKYLSNGQVGLFSPGTQINVRSFKVIAL